MSAVGLHADARMLHHLFELEGDADENFNCS